MHRFKTSILLNTVALVILTGYLGGALLNLFFVPQYNAVASNINLITKSDVKHFSHIHQVSFVHVMDKTTFENDQHQDLKIVPILFLLFCLSFSILITPKPIGSRAFAFHNLRYSYLTFRIFRI